MELTAIPRFGTGHDGPLSPDCGPMASASALRQLVEKQGWQGAAPLPSGTGPGAVFPGAPVPARTAGPGPAAEAAADGAGTVCRPAGLHRGPGPAAVPLRTAGRVGGRTVAGSEDQAVSPFPAATDFGCGSSGDHEGRPAVVPSLSPGAGGKLQGLELLAAAKGAGLLFQSTFPWPGSGSWGGRRTDSRLESAATDLFFCSTEKISPCGLDYTRKAVIMKENSPSPPPCGIGGKELDPK